MRAAARQFRVPLATVQLWVERSRGRRLDRVDWSDRPSGPCQPVNKTPANVENLVLTMRRELKEISPLGEFGAEAIHRELERQKAASLPSVRTIGRILERRGALDGRRRVRRPAPPPGWYLPRLSDRKAELDSFDIVEGLVIRGGIAVEVLTAMSLHGGLPAAWPLAKITAKITVEKLLRHWSQVGLPDYAQFDNDTVFQGPHQHRDVIGRVTRLCLNLGVIPVFAPPQETGFQAAIENFNGRWQAKVWNRFTFNSRRALQSQSAKFIRASRRRAAPRIDTAPARRPFPQNFVLDLQNLPPAQIVYLRRTDAQGRANLLGHTILVDRNWTHRLVRAEVDLNHHLIRFHALRRRNPNYQPLLRQTEHQIPKRPFSE